MSIHLLSELKKNRKIDVNTELLEAPWEGIWKYALVFWLKLLFNLPKKVKAFKPDVILFSSMFTGSLAYPLRNRINIPMVTINHGHDVVMPNKVYQGFVPKIFDALDGVISVSRATQKECIKRGMDPNKGVVIGNGYDTHFAEDLDRITDAKAYMEKKLGCSLAGKRILLTVGRKVKRKGHEWFLNNVISNLPENFIYLSIGDGPEQKELLELQNRLPCKNRIFNVGRQSDEYLKHAYIASDLFIMPNIKIKGDMEGFGIVILEANLARSPVIASNLEGIKDVIKNGINGYLLEPENAESYIDKIVSLGENEKELSSLQTSAYQYVKGTYNWNRISSQYVEYIEQKFL